MSYRVGFLGRGEVGFQVLTNLINHSEITVPIVITCDHGTEVGSSAAHFKALAEANDIPYFHGNAINRRRWVRELEQHDLDLAVAVFWLNIIGQAVIGTTRQGILNLHGAPLPRYRGNACAVWALLNREANYGTCVHLMEPGKLDSGPVVVAEPVPLRDDMTIRELLEDLWSRGVRLLGEAVEHMRLGTTALQPQDESGAHYTYPRLPRDGQINWHHEAQRIADLVRAVGDPYPGAYSWYADHRGKGRVRKLTIHRAHAADHPIQFQAEPGHLLRLDDGVTWAVACGDQRILVLDEIAVDGAPIPVAKAFRTVRQRLGLDVSGHIAALEERLTQMEARLAALEAKQEPQA